MKKLKHIILLAGLLPLIYCFRGPAIESGCRLVMDDIVEHYRQQFFLADQYHFRQRSGIFDKDGKGEWMNLEVWKNRDKTIFQNEYMVMYTDKKVSVTVLHDSKNVVIRDYIKNQSLSNGPQFQLDSLLQFVQSVDCQSQEGKLVLNFSPLHLKKMRGVSRAELDYHEETGQMVRGTYHFKGVEIARQVVEFYDYSRDVSEMNFNGTAVSQVLSAPGTLKSKYQNYTLRDLRNNP